ncbi:MAG: 1-acyl-sn-glycerol-3-phosphate acyltransferase [Deltaproteobacteria bacterium]|nr:1-acyl-sn-glycerol-3-phosphate acyltransferase [Deltaproteobacteria bacterium]
MMIHAWEWLLTPSRELMCVLAAVYLVPLVRLVTLPLSAGDPVTRFVNRWCGRWDISIGWLRDSAGVILLLALSGYSLWQDAPPQFFYLAGPLLSVLNIFWKRQAMDRLIDFLHDHPYVHPQEFFDDVVASRGVIRLKLPKHPRRVLDPQSIDFRQVRGRDRIRFPLLVGLCSTCVLSRLVLCAHRKHRGKFIARLAHAISFLWGARMVQLARAAVVREGVAFDPACHPHRVYLFNHASLFDFVIAPLAFAAEGNPASYAHFIVAKDHFIDNFFVNRILGMGRAMEVLGMIFVDRRRPTKEKAQQVVSQAVIQLADEGAPIMMFPQGTRTRPFLSVNGERLGSAYYASRKRPQLEKEGGHLKKGAAYLGIDAALHLAKHKRHGSVSLIPIGLMGTGIVCPPGSIRLHMGVVMRLRMGEPIVVRAEDVRGIRRETQAYRLSVETLHQKIDDALRSLIKVHAELERRFFEDLRKTLDPLKIEEVAVAMKSWRNDDPVVFVILDYIYACQPKHWRPLLGELVQLLLECAPRERLVELKLKVINALVA